MCAPTSPRPRMRAITSRSPATNGSCRRRCAMPSGARPGQATGLTCYLMPRYRPDGSKNQIRFQRLKDKLGNKSNASSEVEFHGAYAERVGAEGGRAHHHRDGEPTRLDCAIASAGQMRIALSQALNHIRHRIGVPTPAGRPAGDARHRGRLGARKPRHKWPLVFRLAAPPSMPTIPPRPPMRAADAGGEVPGVRARRRSSTKRSNAWAATATLRICRWRATFRESPLNAIWEGSGNVMALDVLRAAGRHPDQAMATVERLDEESRNGVRCPPARPVAARYGVAIGRGRAASPLRLRGSGANGGTGCARRRIRSAFATLRRRCLRGAGFTAMASSDRRRRARPDEQSAGCLDGVLDFMDRREGPSTRRRSTVAWGCLPRAPSATSSMAISGATALPEDWTLIVLDRVEHPLPGRIEIAGEFGEVPGHRNLQHRGARDVQFLGSLGGRQAPLAHRARRRCRYPQSPDVRRLARQFCVVGTKYRDLQVAAGGDEAGVDYVFEIPLALAHSITGFKA